MKHIKIYNVMQSVMALYFCVRLATW